MILSLPWISNCQEQALILILKCTLQIVSRNTYQAYTGYLPVKSRYRTLFPPGIFNTYINIGYLLLSFENGLDNFYQLGIIPVF